MGLVAIAIESHSHILRSHALRFAPAQTAADGIHRTAGPVPGTTCPCAGRGVLQDAGPACREGRCHLRAGWPCRARLGDQHGLRSHRADRQQRQAGHPALRRPRRNVRYRAALHRSSLAGRCNRSASVERAELERSGPAASHRPPSAHRGQSDCRAWHQARSLAGARAGTDDAAQTTTHHCKE